MDTVVSYMPTVTRESDYTDSEDRTIPDVEPEHKNPPSRKFTVNKVNEIEPIEIHDTQMEEVTVINTAL